jgi:hypothetical protein
LRLIEAALRGEKSKPETANTFGGQQVAHHAEVDRQNNLTPVHWSIIASLKNVQLQLENNYGTNKMR